MMEIHLNDNKYLTYDIGKFDEWCVYEVDEKGVRKAPLDRDYFASLDELSKIFNPDKLYEDFVELYNNTGKIFESNEIVNIQQLAEHYENYVDEVFRIFCILYMGMIAEENKRHTRLGKRIKRLGMYNLLKKRLSPSHCANFMKGMSWRDIDKLCIEGGF